MTTSGDPWQAADKAYQAHHVSCPQCIAAGAAPGKQERCPQGQELWDAYTAAGDPPHFTWLRSAPARRPPAHRHQPAPQAGFFTSK